MEGGTLQQSHPAFSPPAPRNSAGNIHTRLTSISAALRSGLNVNR